jgi:hypothetical protein
MFNIDLVGALTENPDPSNSELSETVGGALGFGTIDAAIQTGARSPSGFPYFWSVDRGRRGFGPRSAQALRFEIGGKFVFAKRVGPSQPRYITQKAISALNQNIQAAAAIAAGNDLHAWLASFLNNLADLEALALRANTPTGLTGKLASTYTVDHVGTVSAV